MPDKSSQLTQQSLPAFAPDWALFLDVDGTLLEFANHPDDVIVHLDIPRLLQQLSQLLSGALALVSGRRISTLDQLFSPLISPAAGLHGAERRDIHNNLHIIEHHTHDLDALKAEMDQFARHNNGIVFEDKGVALAIHYRNNPNLQIEAGTFMQQCMQKHAHYELLRGKMVYEIRPAGINKGHAIQCFMEESPFKNRIPVFIGDDITDEDGFKVVNDLEGYSIKVGDGETKARYHLSTINDVVEWLGNFADFNLQIQA